jgi:hypothetical protein
VTNVTNNNGRHLYQPFSGLRESTRWQRFLADVFNSLLCKWVGPMGRFLVLVRSFWCMEPLGEWWQRANIRTPPALIKKPVLENSWSLILCGGTVVIQEGTQKTLCLLLKYVFFIFYDGKRNYVSEQIIYVCLLESDFSDLIRYSMICELLLLIFCVCFKYVN